MELTRDARRQNKIVKSCSPEMWVEWIPATYKDKKGITQEETDLSKAKHNTGRWAIKHKGTKTGKPYLIYIVETTDGNYRDMNWKDLETLKRCENNNKTLYDKYKEWRESEEEREKRVEKDYREEVREKAKEMWGPITGRPYITAVK